MTISIRTVQLMLVCCLLSLALTRAFALNVPKYLQNDPAWGYKTLGDPSYTLANWGCGVTSAAMVFSYLGVYVDPGSLADWLRGNGGFNGPYIPQWNVAGNYPSTVNLHWVESRQWNPAPADLAYLTSQIDKGLPVVLETRINKNETLIHFVVLTAYSGTDLYVNDPSYGDNVRFQDRYGDPSRWIYSADLYAAGGAPAVLFQPLPCWVTTQNTGGALPVVTTPGGTVTGQLADKTPLYLTQGPTTLNGINYYHHNHGGWSAASGTVNGASVTYMVYLQTPAPTGLTAKAPTSTTVNLSWSVAADNVDTVIVSRDGAGDIATLAAGTTTYTDSTVKSGTSYTYHVRLYNANPNNGNSATSDATVTTPGAATLYTITSSAGANGTISPSSSQQVASGGSSTFTATPNANYLVNNWLLDNQVVQVGGTQYTLSGVNANHAVSVTFVSGTVSANFLPLPCWVITQNTGSALPVYWTPGGTITDRLTDGIPMYLFEGPVVVSGVTYYHHNHGGWSAVTGIASGVPVSYMAFIATPGPTSLAAVAPSGTSVNLTWDVSNDPVDAVIVSRDGAGDLATLTPGTTSYTDATVKGGTTYTYHVRTHGANPNNGDSVTSNAMVTTPGATTTYTVTPSAGVNGKISPTTAQTVASGGSLTFTATANTNYTVDTWFVDSVAAQTGGTSFTLANITANHTLNVTFRGVTSSTTFQPLPCWVITQNTGGNLPIYWTPGGTVTGQLGDGDVLYLSEGPSSVGGINYYHHNQGGWAPATNGGSVTYLVYTRTPAPASLTARALSSTSVALAWDVSNNPVDTLIISRDGTGDIATLAAGVTSYTDNTAQPGTTYTYHVRTHNANPNNGDSLTSDATVTTSGTANGSYQPDLLIRTSSETSYTGAGIFNSTGANQTKSLTTPVSTAASYLFHVQNDGTVSDTFTITASAAISGWTVKYLDMDTGADITAAITGKGWSTVALAPGAIKGFWVQVTPGKQVASGATLTLTVTAVSTHAATKVDVVKAVTTRQ